MEKTLTQWHPAFCSAIKLELIANKADLDYQSEVVLNTKPILIDLLVIRKSPDVIIAKDIGHIFKGHNIFEYKSPEDSLNIDTFYKGLAYASLYKANSPTVDGIRADDITISFVREAKPVKLFKLLQSEGMDIEKRANGIYYINCSYPFDIQVIVSSELDKQEYIWLTALTDKLSLESAKTIVIEASKLSAKDDLSFSESVLQVVLSNNPDTFNNIKEVPKMREWLAELMKPELEQMVNDRVNEILSENESIIAEKDAEIESLKKQLAEARCS